MTAAVGEQVMERPPPFPHVISFSTWNHSWTSTPHDITLSEVIQCNSDGDRAAFSQKLSQ